MEVLMSILIGCLFSISVYLILSKSLLRIVIGTAILSHGVNILILTMSGIKKGNAPLLNEHTNHLFNDPLPQALVLTAIVINFSVTSFFLVLTYRTYQELKDKNKLKSKGSADHDE